MKPKLVPGLEFVMIVGLAGWLAGIVEVIGQESLDAPNLLS